MKLADLKRLPIGTKLRLVESLLGPCDKLRVLAMVRATQLVFTCPDRDNRFSYLALPKAKNLEETPDGFAIYEDYPAGHHNEEAARVLCARYVWVKE